MEKLLTPEQLSELLQVKPSTVYKWVHYGYVPCFKLGTLIRFKEKKIEKWLEKRERRGRNTYNIPVDS